jgi:hypothetical protein
MRFLHHLFLACILTLLAGVLAPSAAHADIFGFGDFSDFTVNQNDAGNGPTVSNGTILLTNAAAESRSIFFNTPQNVSQFTASFTYENTGSDAGACFVLQNSAAGASAVGGASGDYGYGGISGKSLAVTFEVNSTSGYYTNGNIAGGAFSTSPVKLTSGDPIDVTLTYDGSLLQESLLDTNTLASYNASYLILTKFPTLLGSSTAYVGLTASTDYGGGNDQYFSNFQFTTSPVPEPSTFALLGTGIIALLGYAWRRRRA